MCKILTSVVVVLAVTAAVADSVSSKCDSDRHDYYRPSHHLVSGVPGTSAPYRRSPCPGLNSLANHGYIPRNGQNISLAEFTSALVSVYNLSPELATSLAAQIPTYPFNMDLLGTHNLIEHDASLVHSDAYFGRQPNEVNATLVANLLTYANSEKRIGIPEAGKVRKDRAASCMKENPTCDLGPKPTKLAFLEAAALVAIMGGRRNNDTISVTHARSFLVNERIPADYKKSELPFTSADIAEYLGRIAAFAK